MSYLPGVEGTPRLEQGSIENVCLLCKVATARPLFSIKILSGAGPLRAARRPVLGLLGGDFTFGGTFRFVSARNKVAVSFNYFADDIRFCQRSGVADVFIAVPGDLAQQHGG